MDTRTGDSARVALARRFPIGLLVATLALGCQSGTEPDPDPEQNRAPTASAGADVVASVGLAVRLDGSGTDAEGDLLTYAWTLTPPAGSAASLDDATAAAPTFTPDVPGDYDAALVVSDGMNDSASDVATVVAEDNTSRESIGVGGGELVSSDGALAITIPADALASDTEISITEVSASQLATQLGPEFDDLLDGIAHAYELGPDGLHFANAITVEWELDGALVAAADSARVALSTLLTSAGGQAVLLDEVTTDADVDAGVVVVSGQLDHFSPLVERRGPDEFVTVGDLPAEAEVGIEGVISVTGRFPAEATAEVSVRGLGGPSLVFVDGGVVRSATSGGAFQVDLPYRCESPGSTTVTLRVAGLSEIGALEEDRFLLGNISAVITCADSGGGGPLAEGLYSWPAGISDIERLHVLDADIGNLPGATSALVGFPGVGGFAIQMLAEASVGLERLASTSLVGMVSARRPGAGFEVPGAILSYGLDFAHPLDPEGGDLYQFRPGLGAFDETPTGVRGAFYDATTAGGTVISDEILGATNFGIISIAYDESSSTYEPGEVIPFDLFGTRAITATAYADSAGGPMVIAAQDGVQPARLYYLDRRGGAPVDAGVLGQSPVEIRCDMPLCAVAMARDNAVRMFSWDGRSAPTIEGDPIGVGFGPASTAVYRLSNMNLLVMNATGFQDHDVTVSEVDAAGQLLTSHSVDVRTEFGCSGPRDAEFVRNAEDPDDPYVVVTCFDTGEYLLTSHFSLMF